MDRRTFLAASSVGVAAAMAGCVGRGLSSDDEAGSTPASDSDETEITVSADGDVESEPDRATVRIGVDAEGDTAEAVTSELATEAEQLREAFDELEIPEDNIEEGRYRVHPKRGEDEDGFRGTRSFEVIIDDVDRVGEVIDGSIQAGADDIGRVNFTLQETTRDELRKDAIDNALANADEEAQHVADNRGVELTGTKSVTTSDVNVHSSRYTVAALENGAEDASGATTEIDADPVSVSASVTVVYTFE
ncbi:SIMPL domain-containing protein [Halopiger djelfimassiliensis]|uniref:SIMPL domain-containing protein n=1 Tax=Halopiger djelfimassiliensis TaxID=1293047 RepID=UPI000677E3FE|nr:SIMPL domain-containing protein [Halopiger djelfimassiliensis]